MNNKEVDITEVIKPSMLNYMEASIYRMLPHCIDGLKPIQRKILWTMYKTKVFEFDKCSSIVGDTAKYITTGDDSVYPALVKMAQEFRNKYLPITMYGNQGYITDNKQPAAKRYTEAKLNNYALDLYFDSDIDFADYIDNYNNKLREPIILPTLLPMSLIMGNKGTATGYTNSILPHSVESVGKAYIRFIEARKGKVSWKKFESHIRQNMSLGIPSNPIILNPESISKGLLTNSSKLIMEGRMEIKDASYVTLDIRIELSDKEAEKIHAKTAYYRDVIYKAIVGALLSKDDELLAPENMQIYIEETLVKAFPENSVRYIELKNYSIL